MRSFLWAVFLAACSSPPKPAPTVPEPAPVPPPTASTDPKPAPPPAAPPAAVKVMTADVGLEIGRAWRHGIDPDAFVD